MGVRSQELTAAISCIEMKMREELVETIEAYNKSATQYEKTITALKNYDGNATH